KKPQMLHARVSTVRANRAFIGHSLRKLDACILEAVNSRKHLRPDHASQRFIARICATIIDVARRNRSNNTFLVEGYTGIAECPFISMCARSHVLRPCLHPFYWTPPRLLRRQRTHGHLWVARNLDAEASTDIERLHTNAVNVNSEVRS